jgi:hypothetical protein
MSAYNVVRFRVKPGMDDAFVAEQETAMAIPLPGARELALIKTGDRAYCLIGKWDSFDSIVSARPQMIAILDRSRHMLEDLGGDLGVTDPVSGPAVYERKV